MGEQYKVKAILYYKSIKNKLQYKVKWLGQPAKDFIQEPKDHLKYCKNSLKKYQNQGLQSIRHKKYFNTTILLQPKKKLIIGYKRLQKIKNKWLPFYTKEV